MSESTHCMKMLNALSMPIPHLLVKRLLETADEHEVDRKWAIARRIAYLMSVKGELIEVVDDWADDSHMSSVDEILGPYLVPALTAKKKAIDGQISRLRDFNKPPKDDITDEEIVEARQVSIEMLVEFDRSRKTRCPFHDDKSPSAYMGRNNRLICPVCNKMWSTIDILVDRDGMTFKQAVKYLVRR